MATRMREVTTCDVCHREPDGESPDHISFLSCGHDVCNECLRGAHRMGMPETPYVCPSCKQFCRIGRALNVEPTAEAEKGESDATPD
jgi:hypothetical protein